MPAAATGVIGNFLLTVFGGTSAAVTAAAFIAAKVIVTATIHFGLLRLSQALSGKPRVENVGPSRDVTVRGTVEPMQMVYGEVRTGGFIAFYGTSNTNNRLLHFVVVVAAHQCEDITDVWLDSRRVPDADINPGGDVTTSEFQDAGFRLQVRRFLGPSAQVADTALVAAFPSLWTSNHRGAGVAYVHFILDFSEKVWSTGAPSAFFSLVRGRRLYDPRLDSTNGGSGSHRANDATTWAWSRNAALARRDYISGGSRWYDVATPEKRLAFGEPDSRINDSFVIAAANICDEAVAIPGSTTQPRYTCDVQLSCGDTHLENLRTLESADVGTTTYVKGQYRIYSGAYDVPAITITEDDILGPVTVSTHPNGEDLYNLVTGAFFDEERDWQLSPFPTITNASYETDDRGQFPRTIELHATRSSYRAQRIAILLLAKSRNKITIRFERLSPKATAIAEHETFFVTIGEYGWTNKPFRCLSWEWSPDGFVALTAREESSAAYADPSVGTYAAPEQATVATPEYDEPDTPTNFEARSMPEGILFRWRVPAPERKDMTLRLYEHTASTPFSSAVDVSGPIKGSAYLLERSGYTIRYYWLVSELNGIQSAATPVGSGLAAAPSLQGFEETFHDSFEHQDYERFYDLTDGAPVVTYPAAGENGGRVLRFQGYGRIRWKKNIPYDPAQLYLLTVRARMSTAPTGGVSAQDKFYCGLEGFKADGVTLDGAAVWASAFDFDFGTVALGQWVTFRGYIGGLSSSPAPEPAPSSSSPVEMFSDTRHVRPVVIMNYNGGNGTMQVDYVRIDRVVLSNVIGPNAVTVPVSAATGSGAIGCVACSGGTFDSNIRTASYVNDTGESVVVQAEVSIQGVSVSWNTAYPSTARVYYSYSSTSSGSGSADMINPVPDGLTYPTPPVSATAVIQVTVVAGDTLTINLRGNVVHTDDVVLGWTSAVARITGIKK